MTTISSSILGISPVSENTLQSINNFSIKNQKYLMIICSRNQIECSSLGGGYFLNLDTEAFMKKIEILKKNNPYLIICRDHCGPYTSDKKSDNFQTEIENTKKSLMTDIKNKFDLIHIDTSYCGESKLEILKDLYNFSINNSLKNQNVYFEFGTTDHGEKFNEKSFFETFKIVKDLKNGIFLTGSTGSLIKGIKQTGNFSVKDCKKMLEIIKESNFKIKDHNCDYLDSKGILLRKHSGIKAFNIGPQLAVIESQQVMEIANKFDLSQLTKKFFNEVIKSKKWEKWCYENDTDNSKFYSTSHYFFTNEIYKEIFKKVSEKIDIISLIEKRHFDILNSFYI